MSVIKVKIQKDFTTLYNGVLENPKLSFKAKGLWAYCMSRPEDWEFHVTHLATVSKEGVDSVYAALKELEKAGLVEKSQPNGGRFGKVEYTIYPYPSEFKKCLPQRDFPVPGIPQTENPALPSIDSYQERKKEPPPTPLKDKKYWRGFFSDWKEEEFEFAWEEYEKAPKGSVKSIKAWLPVPRARFLEKQDSKAIPDRNRKEATKLAKKHHEQAKEHSGTVWKGFKVTAWDDRVEFSGRSGLSFVGYTISDPDWEKETGWKPYKD